MNRFVYQWAALISGAVMSPVASAVDSIWQFQLASHERMATNGPSEIVPTENGFGVLKYDHLLRFDDDGHLLDETWLPRSTHRFLESGTTTAVRSRSCARHVLPVGGVTYEYSAQLLNHYSYRQFLFYYHPERGPDGGGGYFDSLLDSDRFDISEVVRVSPDCTPVPVSELGITHLVNVPNEPAAYGFLHADALFDSEIIALVRMSEEGLQWQKSIDDLLDGARPVDVLPAFDGSALLTLRVGADGASADHLVSIAADGAEQWRWAAPGNISYSIAAPSGAVAIVQTSPSDVLYTLSSDGRLVHPPLADVDIHRVNLLGRPKAEWPYVLTETGKGARAVRIAADGAIEEVRQFPIGFVPRIQLSDDRFVDTWGPNEPRVVDGEGHAITPDSLRTRPVEWRIKATAADVDGLATILESDNEQAKLVLVDRRGVLRWERPLPSFAPSAGSYSPNWRMLKSPDAVCVSYERHWDDYDHDPFGPAPTRREDLPAELRCYARQSGEQLGTDFLGYADDGGAPKLFGLPSGGLLAVTTAGDTFVEMSVREYSSRGVFLNEATTDLEYVSDFPAQPELPVGRLDRTVNGEWSIYQNGRVQRRNPDLTLRWVSELPAGWRSFTYVSAPRPDGHVIVGGTLLSGEAAIAQLDNDGQVLWQRPYQQAARYPDLVMGHVLRFVPVDNDWLDIDEGVTRLSGETGETLFISPVRVPASPYSPIAGRWSSVFRSTESGYIGLVEQLPGESRVTWINALDGSIAGASALMNGFAKDVHVALRDSSDIGRTLVLQTGIGDADSALRVAEVDFSSDRTGPRPTIAQPSVHGVWYEPSSTGQGFFVDYAAGQITGSWFTYTSTGGHDRSQQRWYTLAGTAESGSERTTLTIYRNSGGHFDAGPTTDSVPVGTVDLQFNHCDELVAVIRFDSGVEDTSPRVRVLQRLVPGLHACTDASGQQVGEPATEFERRSGAWFEPETTGQGVFLDVRAPRSDAAAHLVAGWFTYDPEGSHDDPLAQHWLTLLGPIDLESDTATLTINRTIGGSLGGEPTTNTVRVGQATLHFDGCVGATLDYLFDDSEFAASFRSLEGSIALRPLTACADE